MPPQQQNPYDFILKDPPKPSRAPLFGGGLVPKIAVIAILLVLVIIVGFVISSFLGKDKEVQNKRLVEIAQTQTEIIRVSTLAKDKAQGNSARNLAVNTKMSVQTSQQQTLKLLAARGIKEKSLNKQLSAGKNPKTDAALDEATKNSRFDETFTTLLVKQLSDYQVLLQAAYAGSTANERTVLTASFENAALLSKKPEATQ